MIYIKMDKKKIVVVVLAALLIGAFGYFGIGKYNDGMQEKEIEIFQQGAQYGFESAVVQAVQLAVTCEKVPFRIENQTIDMIAVDCLSQGGGQ